jgi:hypothetical protein
MSVSISDADVKTHLKIVVVSLIAAILIVVIGIRAHVGV